MVTIQQHGPAGELFDLSAFFADIERLCAPDAWHICVDWCMGPRAEEIETASSQGLSLSHAEFRSLYCDIYQTVDGEFVGLRDGKPIFELVAVDSSYWEITGPLEFESYMLQTYGAFRPRL